MKVLQTLVRFAPVLLGLGVHIALIQILPHRASAALAILQQRSQLVGTQVAEDLGVVAAALSHSLGEHVGQHILQHLFGIGAMVEVRVHIVHHPLHGLLVVHRQSSQAVQAEQPRQLNLRLGLRTDGSPAPDPLAGRKRALGCVVFVVAASWCRHKASLEVALLLRIGLGHSRNWFHPLPGDSGQHRLLFQHSFSAETAQLFFYFF